VKIGAESSSTQSQKEIEKIFNEVRDFVLKKNECYGDSALNPVRIFSRSSPIEQIMVRLDDKLSRLVRGKDGIETDEDVFTDIMGYCALAVVLIRREKE